MYFDYIMASINLHIGRHEVRTTRRCAFSAISGHTHRRCASMSAFVAVMAFCCVSPHTTAYAHDAGVVSRWRSAGARRPLELDSARCSTRVLAQNSLRTSDGHNPYVASSSEALRNGRALFLGKPVYLFSPSAKSSTIPVAQDTLIGLIVSADGVSFPITTPIRRGYSLYPRVVNAVGRGWEVILIESADRDDGPIPTANATATIWSAHFDGHRWTRVTRAADARGAQLRMEFASHLISDRHGGLAFAYPLDGTSGVNGIVLLRRVGVSWHADTLTTRERVDYVSLARSIDHDSWSLLFRKPSFEPGLRSVGSLFFTVFDGRWRRPSIIVHSEDANLNDPVLARSREGLYASWWMPPAQSGSGSVGSVRYVRIDTAHPVFALQSSLAAKDAAEFRMTELADRGFLWVMRDFASASRIVLSQMRNDIQFNLGKLQLSNDTGMAAVAQNDSTVWLLSSQLARNTPTQPVTTLLTQIRLRCTQ